MEEAKDDKGVATNIIPATEKYATADARGDIIKPWKEGQPVTGYLTQYPNIRGIFDVQPATAKPFSPGAGKEFIPNAQADPKNASEAPSYTIKEGKRLYGKTVFHQSESTKPTETEKKSYILNKAMERKDVQELQRAIVAGAYKDRPSINRMVQELPNLKQEVKLQLMNVLGRLAEKDDPMEEFTRAMLGDN
jgi:hypothetical protein